MPEDVIQNAAPVDSSSVVEAPAPPAPPPAVEAVDGSGVPYKNRAAEAQRKLDEAQQLLQQYQVALGARQQPPPPAPPDPRLAQFDEPTLQMVRTVAEQIAREQATHIKHQTLTEMRLQQELAADAELLPEARNQYALLGNDPMWAGANDTLKQQFALSQAKSTLLDKRMKAQVATQTQAATFAASRNQAAASSLPGTGGAPLLGTDKESYIKNWMSDPTNVRMFRSFERGVDPNSPEGLAKFRSYAENAWTPTVFGGSVAAAMNHIEVVK